MRRQKQHRHNRKDNFFTKLFNAVVTLGLTACLMWGLQAYSHCTSLKFIQLSDVHYLENGANTTFKMIGESPRLLNDAIEQINEQKDLDFVIIKLL